MVMSFSGWLFNLLLWVAIIGTAMLTYEFFVGPLLNELNTLIALGVSVVLSLLWPRL